MAAQPVRIETTDGRQHVLPGADTLKPALQRAPLRYVLDPASAALVSENAFGDKSMVGSAVDLLRVPAETVWIEWEGIQHDGRAQGKAGLLIEADETGRRGIARIAWQNEAGDADLSPFSLVFDLDCEDYAMTASEGTCFHVQCQKLVALDPLLRRVRFALDPQWEDYFRTYSRSPDHLEEALRSSLRQIAGDLPFAAAFFLMASTRSAFEETETDLTRLNRRRAGKGRIPLLDHVTVSLNLADAVTGYSGAFDGERSGPRLHHVSGHLVRRGDAIFWRRAHLRGNPASGLILAKTVEVHARSRRKAA